MKSNHTFAEREAIDHYAFVSTLDRIWNDNNKTSFNFIYRDNEMNQIPSYRISTRSPNLVKLIPISLKVL